MTVKLYDFQREDISALAPMESRMFGHEMATGKSVMALVTDKLNRAQWKKETGLVVDGPIGKTLIICKRRAMLHWWLQIEKVCPEMLPFTYIVEQKNKTPFEDVASDPSKPGIFICYWQSMIQMPRLRKVKWFHIIADEVHRMGGRDTQQTRATKALRTKYKTGLSGTWSGGNYDRAWSVLNWLWPRYYTSYWRFRNEALVEKTGYVKTGQYDEQGKPKMRAYKVVTGIQEDALERLLEQMKPYYRRRLRKDVLPDLPPKQYTIVPVDLEPAQRRMYDEMRDEMVAWVDDLEGNEQPLVAPNVAVKLQRLQQMAISSCRIEERKRYSKKQVRDRETGKLRDEGWVRYKVVVMQEPSPKLDVCMEIIEDLGPNDKVVVFTQFKQPVYMLVERLKKAKIKCSYLTSDVSDAAGDRMYLDFIKGDSKVFVSTIASGGESLDFPVASTAIFIDRAWEGWINDQAEDRLPRPGQLNPFVNIIDIIARNTIDHGRNQKIRRKWAGLRRLLGDNVDNVHMADPDLKEAA